MTSLHRYNKPVFRQKVGSLTASLLACTAFTALLGNGAIAATLTCNNTLYFCANPGTYDEVRITTSVAGKPAPLAGFGVYMDKNGDATLKLKDVFITASGGQADAIRTNSEAVFFQANNLTIKATGTSGDGINLASNFNVNADSVVYVKNSTTIESTNGSGVRANNFQNAGSNTIVILAGPSSIKVTGTGTANNVAEGSGYAVYAGNRNTDTNGLGTLDIISGKNNNTLGSSYVFVAGASDLASSMRNGHVVYANKGGLIQLGDNTTITANGQDAYALYAATEQQGTYTTNVRPGSIYLEGGATVRANGSSIVMRASGAGSVIANMAMDVPQISDSFVRTDRLNLDRTVTHETSGVFDIVGKIDAIAGGAIRLNMTDASSFLGSSDVHLEGATPSEITLNISGAQSKWTLNADSTLSTLNLKSGAVLTPYSDGTTAANYALTGAVNSDAGILDLADAAGIVGDTLTINGNYSATNGVLRLNTFLNDGGALTNQTTDRLLINGNVTGTTMVTVVPATGSTGGDTFAIGGPLAGQGISIIQVAGTAAENSFQLAGGYVTLGGTPYQYHLAAFGPGASNGAAIDGQRVVGGTNPFWDYRLQNTYVEPPVEPPPSVDPTPGEPTPVDPAPAAPSPATPEPAPVRAVAPQVASYLTAVPALFHAGFVDISNLHRRLGDIRDDRAMGRNSGTGEFFLRAYGGKYDYASNRNAYSYGYDADIDYAAVQLGGNVYALEGKNGVTRLGIAGSIGALSFNPKNVNGTKATDLNKWTVSAHATYLDNKGWYVDAIASFGGFTGDVSTTLRGRTSGMSGQTFAASLETGYPIRLGFYDLSLEPQAQLVYERLKFDRAHDVDNFVVALGEQDQLIGRLGARLVKTYQRPAKDSLITVYAKANVLHGFLDGGTAFFGDTFSIGRYGTSLEGGLGVNATLTKNLSLYGDAAYQHRLGRTGISGFTFTGGARYAF